MYERTGHRPVLTRPLPHLIPPVRPPMTNPECDRAPLRIEPVYDTTIVHLQTREVLWSFPGYEDAETLKEELKSLADQGHRDILLDLEMVEYAVSMFLGVLMLAERRLHETGGRLRLCSIQPD